MGVVWWWRHARKRWSWEFKDFEKSQLRLDQRGRELSFCHLSRELSFLLLQWRLSFSDLDRRRGIEILNITRCAARWDGVSIVRIVSLSSCRHEPKSEIYKPFVSETTESACFRLCFVFVSAFVYVLYYCSDWYHYNYSYTTKQSEGEAAGPGLKGIWRTLKCYGKQFYSDPQ